MDSKPAQRVGGRGLGPVHLFPEAVIDGLVDWLIDWLIDWLTDSLIHWLLRV